MSKKTIIFFSVVVSIFMIFSVSCKKKKSSIPSFEIADGTGVGDLHVTHVSPKGTTSAPHEADKMVIIFDQPMVPLQALSEETDRTFLKIDPPVKGKSRWMGSRILTFRPENRLSFATTFHVSIPRGISSLNNYVLKNDFSWTFTSVRPRIENTMPRHKQKWLGLDTKILLLFNQAINTEKATDFLAVKSIDGKTGKEEAVPVHVKQPSREILEKEKIDASPEEVLIIEPVESLKPAHMYYVEVKAGLPASEGPLGLEKTKIFHFETFQEFVFEEIENPKRINPYDSLRIRFSNPVTYKEFINNIYFEPQLEIPDYYQNYEYSSNTLYLSLPLKPETEYLLKIDKELKDTFENTLDTPIETRFSTGSYEPYVSMTSQQAIMEAGKITKYPIYVMNKKEAFFEGARIDKNRVIPLLNNDKIFWSNEKVAKEGFFKVQRTLRFEAVPNTRSIYGLELEELLDDGFGLVFVQLDTQLKDRWSRYPKAFLQITNLGITAKFSPENNFIWVTGLDNGLPVSGADVEIRDDSNSILWKGNTDEKGAAISPGWKKLGIKVKDSWSKPRQWVFAGKGKDLAFTASDWGTGVYPYRFGISYDWHPEPVAYQGYIFSERGIYRAGETVHIKGMIRENEQGRWEIPSKKKVECEVTDPFHKNIFKKKIPIDDFGSFDFDLLISEEASLGTYWVNASIPSPTGGEDAVFNGSFRIEAFRPAEFEVHLRTEEDSYTFGREYTAQIKGSYLFGGAMGGQKVSWHLRLNPSSFFPPGHKGYIFGAYIDLWDDEERETSRLLSSGEDKLDENGILNIRSELIPEKEKSTVQATLEATVEGPSRQSISNRIQTLIHRGDYYIGLKPSSLFFPKGKALDVSLITVKPDGSPEPGKKIVLQLIKREWHSVKKSGFGGRFNWISEKKDIEIASKEVETDGSPLTVSFSPEKSGYYILRAEGRDVHENVITTSTSVYITGGDYVPWERENDDAIELVADSESYHPGDTAKILVKSPYEKAMALVTLEREFILDSRIYEVNGSTELIEVSILSDYIPNVFLSVILVKGRTAELDLSTGADSGKPSFKIGYINLPVDPSEKRLNIDIKKDREHYKPGDQVTVTLNVTDSGGTGVHSSLALAVVDVGVLNLIGYQTPDPFSRFYQQKPLSVETAETRQHVLEQKEYGEKGEETSGGGGERALAAQAPSLSEVELRGDFKSTAYWNPDIRTDETGKASVTFELPDNLTTFRIMAVSQTVDSRFGRGETVFRVSKPLLLQAALPRFARIGDHFEAGIVVHNQTTEKNDVLLSCEANGIKMVDKKNTRELTLAPGEGKEARFQFEAETPGEAVFSFRAVMGQDSDGLEITIPLEQPRPSESVAFFDQTEKSKEEKIKIPENIFPALSGIEFVGSGSALSRLSGNVDFLTNYPYFCLEQRLSSILPYILASDILIDFKISRLSRKDMEEHVQNHLNEILTYQKENGGFGLWPDSRHDSPYLTCYALFTLQKASENGYGVPGSWLEDGKRYLQNLVRGRLSKDIYPYGTKSWKTIEAFALYDLAILKHPEPSFMEKLYVDRQDLSLFGQTLLFKALNRGGGTLHAQNTLLQEILNKVKVTPSTAHFEEEEGRTSSWIYSSNMRTTSFILQALVETGTEYPLIPQIARWLVEKRKAEKWSSTQNTFYAFYAMNEYYKRYEKTEPDFSIETSLEKNILLEESFGGGRNKTVRGETSLEAFKPGSTVRLHIKKKGQGTLFYGTRMMYTPSVESLAADEGFSVQKKILTMNGNPVKDIEAGKLYVIQLDIGVPQESLFVVVDDPLPAGFEAVNPTFVTESREDLQRLQTLGENQNRGWWFGFNHIEMHDNRVLLFADSLTPGVHTHSYLVRAITFGSFNAPGTKVEEMYAPETFGRSEEIKIKISLK
ncbi:MAG: Ig-like domain-containing protein [Candidatus Aminicenantes bacterium]|nr:Ig-like domain-containing protein [Candidatus Aminicenantes bacterium]